MARKPITDMSAWPSLSLEGNLIAPAMIAKIDQRAAPEQAPEDYSVRKGLTIREEISTAFRVGQSHFDAFAKVENPTQEATRRFVSGLFKETFGYDDLQAAEAPIALIASGRVPFVVVPMSETLDRRSPTLSIDRSRSPAFALQDYLNDKDEALWGIVTSGTHLRLMRDNASLTRPAYIEADLAQIFSNEDIASFAVLWLLIHRSRFGNEGAPATDCPLERWRETGSKEGEVARDRLADQVQIALKVLGSGFLEANPDLATKLKSGEVNLTEWFNELLRLVYRLIFLMVAEDRNLLHPTNAKTDARSLYAQGYSLAALRKQCYRAATWDKHHDRYEGVKIVFNALAHGQLALALPALGGLFADDRLPHLETARLRNKAFMEALYRLSWLSDKTGMVPVNWRAMETEELGSVYESLLELQPQLGDDGKTLVFASEAAEQKGNQRKTTGSYYTPDSLVQALLDTALDPVLDKTEAEADDPAKALLKLSVIDPACGSGHFLLAAARRIATRLARIRAEGTPSLADFRHALRDVARCCIHGVDRNPMAVELTKVALWIETVDPGLPLGFFDAQIRCGDALLGVFDLKVLEDGIPDAAYKPLTGDDKDVAKFYDRANKDAKKGQGTFDFTGGRSDLPTAPLSAEFSDLRDLPEETVEDVEAKEKAYRSLRKQDAFLRARMGCNLYTAAFLLPKTGEVPNGDSERTVPTSQDVWLAVGQGKGRKPIMENAKAATRARALHWPLEFPDILGRGGFDVVLGNPPWDQIELDPEGFFANSAPEISTAKKKADKDKLIDRLSREKPELYRQYLEYCREIWSVQKFIHGAERFPTSSYGRLNTAPLFVELCADLINADAQAGLVVPTSVATDSFNQKLFDKLFSEKRLASLVDFENSAPLFPGVHRSQKFCLLTLGRDEPETRFAFFLTEPWQLAEPERNFVLSPEQIAAINPNTKTAPVFRSRIDAELTTKMYAAAPVFIEEARGRKGNAWDVSFQLMFMMGGASEKFETATDLESGGFVRNGTDWIAPGTEQEVFAWRQRLLENKPILDSERLEAPSIFIPLFEGKMISFFDHRAAGYGKRGDERGYRVLPETEQEEHQDPSFEVEPFYWVPEEDVTDRVASRTRSQWLIGWKDVTAATNERTTIAAVLPLVAVGHTMPLLFTPHAPEKAAALLANLNSIPLDYVARLKVAGLHLTYGYIKQFPVLAPDFYSEPRLNFVTSRVMELTYTSHSLAPFARDLGHDGPPFAWDEDRRADLRADLDAFYARAYGLTRDELRYILDPADVKGPEYPSETFRVLKEKEIRQHGEYRTRRLVLAAWDRMEANGEFTAMGM
ncbi:N-6 DNA methylase [Ruegeria sp. HKCCSP351]|uniref:Eco57I restriction-modification methylase domain-containing protein n=1 Tax=Ruegeria sp. HKCCSP351 TaxID=2794832 RepID=UPI001AE491BC|nr:N-6 DNA methylase [Ruegeria sp. HKCCSP351]